MNVREVVALVRAARTDGFAAAVGSATATARTARAIAFGALRARQYHHALLLVTGQLAGMLDEREVHLLGGDLVLPGLCEQIAQHILGPRRVLAAHAKGVPVAADLHAQARFHQPQVRLERPTEARQTPIVRRFEREFALRQMGARPRVRARLRVRAWRRLRAARVWIVHAASSRPRSECARASVTVTAANRFSSESGPVKFTQRLFSVRPASSARSRLARRSTSTRCVLPTMARLMPSACASSSACRRTRRACLTSCATSSGNAAAGVPGRAL